MPKDEIATGVEGTMLSEKEFKSPLKFPDGGHEMVTCHYPLRLDTYLNCFHDCAYCVMTPLLQRQGRWNPNSINMADFEKIEHKFERALNGRGRGPIAEALHHKLPVRLGGLTDCFQAAELQTGTTLKVLKLLNKHDYPFMIVTKSDMVAREEYLEEITKGKAYIQVSIISLEEEVLRRLEPGAPPVSRRIEAIKTLADKGVAVCARLSPIIPGLSTDRIEEYIYTVAKAGAKHILAEFLKATKPMIRKVEELAGISLMGFMKKKEHYRYMNIGYKDQFFAKVRSLCDEAGIGFSVCNEGDLTPRRFNTTVNCCGTDSIPGFENCCECTANNLAYAVQKKEHVTLNEMKDGYWSPNYKYFEKMWESGRIEQLVDGVQKSGDEYIRK